MKLELLDINEYVEKYQLKPVTSVRIYEKAGKISPEGLFSEEIFGKLGSAERRRTFAYIDLKITVIHPEVYPIITGLDVSISKLLTNKVKYIVTENGDLVEDDKNGSSGVMYFIRNFDKINIDKFRKNKSENVEFIEKNKKKIFIDKYLVLPAGIRDIIVTKTSGQTLVNFSDLSELYSNLIRYTNALGSNIKDIPEEILIPISEQIQKTVCEINNWIKNRLKGKSGLIRGGLLKKVVDYSGRLVITTDNSLPLGTIGLPWAAVLKLYEPFAINYILKKDKNALSTIQFMLKMDTPPDIDDLKRLFKAIIDKPELVPQDMVDYFMYVANEIVKDKCVLYKRDPVNSRSSWLAGNVRVDREGMSMKLNPLDLDRVGGDHDKNIVAF